MPDDFIRRGEFEAVKQSVNREIRDIKMGQEKLASKNDLTLQTQFLTLKIDNTETARTEREAQKWRTIQIMFWTLGGIGTILGAVSVILTLAKTGKG